MKVNTYREIAKDEYHVCEIMDTTHIHIHTPGPVHNRFIPVCLHGSRREASRIRGEGVFNWNGDVEKPTLYPSLKVVVPLFLNDDPNSIESVHVICHSFITDGRIHFLDGSSHQFRGSTMDLLEID